MGEFPEKSVHSMTRDDHKLDNPVWYSLAETHKDFAIQYDEVKCYHPDHCPFGGFVNIEKTSVAVGEYSKLINDFYVVGNKPIFENDLKLRKELVCAQMILETAIDIEISEDIKTLQAKDHDKLFNLVNLIQPGYFRTKTDLLGNYYGIYQNGHLIAVTGERMKMNFYTEVSAVVTHPEHLRKGYAKQLIAYATRKIFDENKIPYLHVADTNAGAIKLYEGLGFRIRRKISFWNLVAV